MVSISSSIDQGCRSRTIDCLTDGDAFEKARSRPGGTVLQHTFTASGATSVASPILALLLNSTHKVTQALIRLYADSGPFTYTDELVAAFISRCSRS